MGRTGGASPSCSFFLNTVQIQNRSGVKKKSRVRSGRFFITIPKAGSCAISRFSRFVRNRSLLPALCCVVPLFLALMAPSHALSFQNEFTGRSITEIVLKDDRGTLWPKPGQLALEEVVVTVKERGVRFVLLHICEVNTVTAILEQEEPGGYELGMCGRDSRATILVSGRPEGQASAYSGDLLGGLVLFVSESVQSIDVRFRHLGLQGVVLGPAVHESRVSVSRGEYRSD